MKREMSSLSDTIRAIEEETENISSLHTYKGMRIYDHGMVLDSVCFDSGTHCWDVEVGDCLDWDMWVISRPSREIMSCLRKYGVLLRVTGFRAYSPSQKPIFLKVKHDVQRTVRVEVCLYPTQSTANTFTRLHTSLEKSSHTSII
ncbi:unnamed protein product [Coregonus sp. 'balchen']|nr:unnamed protein product [Coregonus sp. 'balchen']